MPTVDINGLDLAYRIDGDGRETLVLVNGLADTKESWEAQLPAFSERYRVVSYDNRGCGESPTPAGPYTTAEMADDLAGLVDALELDRFHLLGVSMGGMIAQEYAIANAERLAVRLVLLHVLVSRPLLPADVLLLAGPRSSPRRRLHAA